MLIQIIPLSDLHPAPYNPRLTLKPGDKRWKKLERSLAEFELGRAGQTRGALLRPILISDLFEQRGLRIRLDLYLSRYRSTKQVDINLLEDFLEL